MILPEGITLSPTVSHLKTQAIGRVHFRAVFYSGLSKDIFNGGRTIDSTPPPSLPAAPAADISLSEFCWLDLSCKQLI